MGNDWSCALIGLLASLTACAVQAESLTSVVDDVAAASDSSCDPGLPAVAACLAYPVRFDSDEPLLDTAASDRFADCGDFGCCDCLADCCCDRCQPHWKFEAGTVILHRASPRSLVLLRNETTGEAIANAGNFKFPWRGGADISLARRGSYGEIEVRYFGVDDWLSHRAIDISQDIDSGGGEAFVFGAAADYTSELHSTEINWRRPLTQNINGLIGFRWVELHEVLAISAEATDAQFPIPVTVRLPFDTSNHLYGSQIGAEVLLWSGDSLSIDTTLKAGLYGNHANSGFAIQLFDFTLGSLRTTGSDTAFLGEIDVNGTYQWTEHVAFRAGYQLLWISGAALPPEQLARFLAGNAGIDIAGTVFFHGATAGVELYW